MFSRSLHNERSWSTFTRFYTREVFIYKQTSIILIDLPIIPAPTSCRYTRFMTVLQVYDLQSFSSLDQGLVHTTVPSLWSVTLTRSTSKACPIRSFTLRSFRTKVLQSLLKYSSSRSNSRNLRLGLFIWSFFMHSPKDLHFTCEWIPKV